MPKLISLYIRNVLFGFALSGVFVGTLLYMNIANMWHLVSTSSMGWVAAVMLFMFNGIVFAGVQFAIAIMRMEKDDAPKGGKRDPLIVELQPIAIPVDEGQRPRR
jgi:TRAP-type C4-dicarboxylate transport system permease small subunit